MLHYPHDTSGVEQEIAEAMANEARHRVDPSDLLAYTIHELLSVPQDEASPLWDLVRHCARKGTEQETGKVPHPCEGVGEAFLPLIDRAVVKLVQETLDREWGE